MTILLLVGHINSGLGKCGFVVSVIREELLLGLGECEFVGSLIKAGWLGIPLRLEIQLGMDI